MRSSFLDSLRGIAILLMMLFHLIFNLVYFSIFSFSLTTGFGFIFQQSILSLFLILVGVSLTYSKKNFRQTVVQAGKIGLFALGITLVTFVFFPEQLIFFGVLHLISLSILLGYFFKDKKLLSLLVILGIVLLTVLDITTDNKLLSFLIICEDIISLDYTPLLPYFGMILFGILLEKEVKKRNSLKITPFDKINSFLSFLGKHSLFIYVTHQLVLFPLSYLLSLLL